jgi:hypothetical protein
MIPQFCEYWYLLYRKKYSAYMAEAIRNKLPFSQVKK